MCSVSHPGLGIYGRQPTRVGTYFHDCLQLVFSISRRNGMSTGSLTDEGLGCSTGVLMGLGTGGWEHVKAWLSIAISWLGYSNKSCQLFLEETVEHRC